MLRAIVPLFLSFLLVVAASCGTALVFKDSNGHAIFTDGHPVDVQIMSAGCVSSDQFWATRYLERNFRVMGFKADLYRCQFQDQLTYELSTQGYYLVVFKK